MTSGVDQDTDRVIAARVALLDDDGAEIARWDWGSDRGEAIVGEVAQALRVFAAAGIPLATFEAAVGLTILDRELQRHHLEPLPPLAPVLDPLLLDHLIEPTRGARTLPGLAERYGVEAGPLAAGRLVRAMLERLDGSVAELHERQAALIDGWPVLPLDDIRLIEDTQPLPKPRPRPSDTVPVLDFRAGVLSLESRGPVTSVIELAPPPDPETAAFGITPAAVEETPQPPTEIADEPREPREAPEPPPVSSAGGKARRIHVAAAIVTDPAGRALVVRKRGTTGFMQPGGKIERGESALACLVRELREELGLEVVIDETEFLGSFEADALNEPGARVRAEVFALVTDATLSPGQEIEELYWLSSPTDVRSVELAPLTLEVLLPLWASRRPALF